MLDPNELFPEVPNLYEFPSVHADMIYDEQRVSAYQAAIGRTVRKGDVVVDVGTGTGILSFLALRAGARHVHAIDRSPVIQWAQKLAAANGYSDAITFHPSDSRDTEIPDRADVLLSELIGHMVFEEGMVEALFDAKRRFLRSGGRVVPQTVTLLAAPVCEQEVYATSIDCWRTAYGIDYSIMRNMAVANSYLTEIREKELLASPLPVSSVDFVKDRIPATSTTVDFTTSRPGTVNGLALWFDALLADEVRLSSGPWTKTHWLQCFAPLPKPLDIAAGEKVSFVVDMSFRSRENDQFQFRARVDRGD